MAATTKPSNVPGDAVPAEDMILETGASLIQVNLQSSFNITYLMEYRDILTFGRTLNLQNSSVHT